MSGSKPVAPKSLHTVSRTTFESSTDRCSSTSGHKRFAFRYASELGSLIAERDALENEFRNNSNAIRHTLQALDNRITDLRSVVVSSCSIEKPFLEILPPQPEGEPVITISEKKFFPKNVFPSFNFAGRILGPKGSTIRNIEKKIPNCKLAVRGKGSRPLVPARRELWEQEEELHLSITIIDTTERAAKIMEFALKVVEPFFHPIDQREDLLKDTQMRELAHIRAKENGSRVQFAKPVRLRSDAQQLPLYPWPGFPHFTGPWIGGPHLNVSNFHASPNPVLKQAPGLGLVEGGAFGFDPMFSAGNFRM